MRGRRNAERVGSSEQTGPGALRQRNAVSHPLLQDAVATLARQVDALDAVIVRQRPYLVPEPVRFSQNALDIAECGEIDRHRDAIEKGCIQRATRGEGRPDDRVTHRKAAETLDHEGQTRPLRPAQRQQGRHLLGVGGVASLRVHAPAERNVAAGVARTHYFSHCDVRGRHVEQERRPALGRKGNRKRIARYAGDLGAVIRHHRAGGRHDDARHSCCGGLQREVTDRPGVGDVACCAPADVDLARPVEGLLHRPRHRDRARRAVRVQYRDGARADLHAHIGCGIDELLLQPVDIARYPQHAVRIHAAQVRPHQRLRPFVRHGTCNAQRLKQRARKTLEIGTGNKVQFARRWHAFALLK